MKILLTGASGQLGRCIVDALQETDHLFVAPDSSELNITQPESIPTAFAQYRPDIVINTAAYTAVDKAEQDVEQAFRINELGPRLLAKACQQAGIPLIHLSTDYVFDGTATAPYSPDAVTSPQNVYGQSKLKGEKAIQEESSEYVILRTSWLFSEYQNNFAKTILRLAHSRDSLAVVADQYGSPTYAGDIASAIVGIIDQISAGNHQWGIYHYVGDRATSWHGFAVAIIDEASMQSPAFKRIPVKAIGTEDYPTPAKRPAFSVLDMTSTEATWNIKPSNWRAALVRITPKVIAALQE
ncbi:dTDP-4-dehydrorhamnose reductase [Pokkaliibacter sp. CJK22405]|uniref:dTDP-4-dehydrorhamnose reductase n=1 Tax=Pokkaliibacter sp. CJK22405 TaxID=3384615 RepID=UPI003985552F